MLSLHWPKLHVGDMDRLLGQAWPCTVALVCRACCRACCPLRLCEQGSGPVTCQHDAEGVIQLHTKLSLQLKSTLRAGQVLPCVDLPPMLRDTRLILPRQLSAMHACLSLSCPLEMPSWPISACPCQPPQQSPCNLTWLSLL